MRLIRITFSSLLLASVVFAGLSTSPSLVQAASPRYVAGELVVALQPGYSLPALELPEDVQVMETDPELTDALDVYVLHTPSGEEDAVRSLLASNPAVAFVERNAVVQAAYIPDDPLWSPGSIPPASPSGQYGQVMVNAPDAWDMTTGSASVILAVLDSGIDASHAEFSGRLLPGYDFIDDDNTPQDGCGHGTHVTGIAAATGDNSLGVAGMDWHTSILPVRVLDDTCLANAVVVASGIVYAVDHGADVINLSLGTAAASFILESATYYAYSHGVAVIASAGNSGSSPVWYPARYPWVLSVGAVDESGTRLTTSSYGSDLDLTAPGNLVLSTTPNSAYHLESTYGIQRGYGTMTGTSMAAGFVSGAATLLLAANPGRYSHPIQLYQALMESAQDRGTTGRDDYYGWGILDADEALDFIPTVSPPTAVVEDISYEWITSDVCENQPYAWVDASTGTNLNLTLNDSLSGWVTLPFTFNLGGDDYSQLLVSANGFLSFDPNLALITTLQWAQTANNFRLPGIGLPNQMAAPFWDDLNPALNGSTSWVRSLSTGTYPNRRFVIEWYQIPLAADSTSRLTFEVILYESSNEIVFQYQTLQGAAADGDSATIGLEYDNGLSGVEVAYLQNEAVGEGEAFHFYPYSATDTVFVPGCVYSTEVTAGGMTASLGSFSVVIPAGAAPAGARIRMELLTPSTSLPPGVTTLDEYANISFEPEPGLPLDPNLQVCYHYSAQDVLDAGGLPQNLFLAVFNGSTWQALPTALDLSGQQICSIYSMYHLYGVFALQPNTTPLTGGEMVLPAPWRSR